VSPQESPKDFENSMTKELADLRVQITSLEKSRDAETDPDIQKIKAGRVRM